MEDIGNFIIKPQQNDEKKMQQTEKQEMVCLVCEGRFFL